MSYTKNSMLVQSAQVMRAQANQLPQTIFSCWTIFWLRANFVMGSKSNWAAIASSSYVRRYFKSWRQIVSKTFLKKIKIICNLLVGLSELVMKGSNRALAASSAFKRKKPWKWTVCKKMRTFKKKLLKARDFYARITLNYFGHLRQRQAIQNFSKRFWNLVTFF